MSYDFLFALLEVRGGGLDALWVKCCLFFALFRCINFCYFIFLWMFRARFIFGFDELCLDFLREYFFFGVHSLL